MKYKVHFGIYGNLGRFYGYIYKTVFINEEDLRNDFLGEIFDVIEINIDDYIFRWEVMHKNCFLVRFYLRNKGYITFDYKKVPSFKISRLIEVSRYLLESIPESLKLCSNLTPKVKVLVKESISKNLQRYKDEVDKS